MRPTTAVTAVALSVVALGCSSSGDDGNAASSTTSSDNSSSSGSGGTAATGTGGTGGGGNASGGDGGAGAGWAMPPPNYCNLCAAGPSFVVANLAIDEASGIVASADHDGIYYVHNDSGDLPRFFALDSMAGDQGEYALQSGAHEDYEDIARGPCSAGSCLYIADIGDNDEVRSLYTLYRVPEPDAVGPGTQGTLPSQLKYQYPDGSHNGQALLVHPITGEIAVVQSVSNGASTLYGVDGPWNPAEVITLAELGQVEPPQGSKTIGGGDVHPLGHGILLRTFTHVYYYPAAGPREALADTLSGTPCVLPAPMEVQGEAVGWTTPGDGYVTIGEGTGSPINHVSCTSE